MVIQHEVKVIFIDDCAVIDTWIRGLSLQNDGLAISLLKAFLLSAHMDDLRILLRLFHEKETRRAIDRARTSNHKNDDFSVSSWDSKDGR